MAIYSTILSSNNAGGRDVIEEWLRDHRFFMAIERDDMDMIINDDLSLTIKAKKRTTRIGNDEWEILSDICITQIPPFGIKEINGFRQVRFMNIIDDDKLPFIFNDCGEIIFSYCRLKESYINNLKESLKKNPSKWRYNTQVSLEHTALV